MKNTGITLIDVREAAHCAIRSLREGSMNVKTSSEIRKLLNVIIDTGNCQVDFLKALPDHIRAKIDLDSVKAIAGTLRDRDADLDETLEGIEKKRNTYNLESSNPGASKTPSETPAPSIQTNHDTQKKADLNMTVQEAAKYLGKSTWFVYDQIKTGKLTPVNNAYRKQICINSIKALANTLKNFTR